MTPEEIQKAKNDLEARLGSKGKAGLPICEVAYMADGIVLVGYTNRDENGGFTPVGDLTAWFRKREAAMAEALRDTEETTHRRVSDLLRQSLADVLEQVSLAAPSRTEGK